MELDEETMATYTKRTAAVQAQKLFGGGGSPLGSAAPQKPSAPAQRRKSSIARDTGPSVTDEITDVLAFMDEVSGPLGVRLDIEELVDEAGSVFTCLSRGARGAPRHALM
jgi:hypothetical protein